MSSCQVHECTFANNSVYSRHESVVFRSLQFIRGGAIAPTVKEKIISNNPSYFLCQYADVDESLNSCSTTNEFVIRRSTFDGNTAFLGGAIFVKSGRCVNQVLLDQCHLERNSARQGAALYIDTSLTVAMLNLTVERNVAEFGSVALISSAADLDVHACNFTGEQIRSICFVFVSHLLSLIANVGKIGT